jgi:hypothetical protein
VVEGARLESVFRGNSNVGSNPTLSAILFPAQAEPTAMIIDLDAKANEANWKDRRRAALNNNVKAERRRQLITANAESIYQRLLQFAAEILRRAETAEVNRTYMASVVAVDAITPRAISGLGACM